MLQTESHTGQHPLFWDWDITNDNQIVPFALDGLPSWPSDDDDGQDDNETDFEQPLDQWVEEAEDDYEGEDEQNDEDDEIDRINEDAEIP